MAKSEAKSVRFESAEKTKAELRAEAELEAKIRSIQFKSQHFLVATFFFWLFLVHIAGIYFFTKGFLLTRLVLDHKSSCTNPPIELDDHGTCWYPKTFDKAVVIIIDALRYDFTVPQEEEQHYWNALTVLHETAVAEPHNAILRPFIADPPTTTLQRLKGLTTGTLPTFIDAGSNFAGTAIDEDNLVRHLRDANKTVVHLGDDTWHALFPGYFEPNLTHPFDSFNVWDLHTVDNGVNQYLFPLLETPEKWDVIFGHYLGVDHAGHRYGPDHPAMTEKLRQMDGVVRDMIKNLDDETLLVVMGDHGMDAKGDHGGESDDEVEAALWMYSKKGVFGRSREEHIQPPKTAKERRVAQIDLVPTLSLLLGLPVPFNNLGGPIEEAFLGKTGDDWKRLASVQALSAAQINHYQDEYAKARGLDESSTSGPLRAWNKALQVWDSKAGLIKKSDHYQTAATAFSLYQQENLRVCKSLWARFDVPSMILGVAILALGLVSLLSLATSTQNTSPLSSNLVKHIGFGGFLSLLPGVAVWIFVLESSLVDSVIAAGVIGSLVGFASGTKLASWLPTSLLPNTLWGWAGFVFTVSQSVGFASNSYTIWEDEILLCFISTFAALSLISSLRQATKVDRVLGAYHSILFLLLTRLASLSRLCREEQMPYCRSTYYASATSSTSSTWQLSIPYILAMVLPSIIKSYYQGTKSFEASSILWISYIFRIGLFGSAAYWTLDAADNGNWLPIRSWMIGSIKVTLAQIILGVAGLAGSATFLYAPPCIKISTASPTANSPNSPSNPRQQITVLGFMNVHGSRYALLIPMWLLAMILVQKPMGGGAMGLLGWSIFSLAEILDTNGLADSSIGPVVLGLLGAFYYFKTGHQATLASIQWDSAFIAFRTIQYPGTPLTVLLNTFGAQILAVIAVPMLVLWKQPPRRQGLLGKVARAMAVHVAYYAVINLATTMWAGHLRRHLMLYRIFNPRFMAGALALVVVDLFGIMVALVSVRVNASSVAEVFGW